MEAFAKALSEAGENVLVYTDGLESRCGMAAGLFASQAEVRARGELLERDAFLFHYRSGRPFRRREDSSDLLVFEMDSASDEFHAILVTDLRSAEGSAPCLLFGTSAHPDMEIALEKAAQEYSAIRLNHRLHPNRCSSWEVSPDQVPTVMDLHHVASRDIRNIERFKSLCGYGSADVPISDNGREPLNKAGWKISVLSSPIRTLSFVRAEHPDLIRMTFGLPEASGPGEPPLYHPFW